MRHSGLTSGGIEYSPLLNTKQKQHQPVILNADLIPTRWYENATLFGPIVTVASLLLGVIFYCADNQWNIQTSIFYTISTLLGVLFYVPANKSTLGDIFSILYYVYGAFFFAGVVGTYGGWLVANAPEIAAEERRKLIADHAEDVDGDGVVGVWDHVTHWKNVLLHKLGWEHHRTKYLTVGAVLVWIGVGVLYGMYFERWAVKDSFVFALSTVSAAGQVPPPCIGDDPTTCDIGTLREFLLSVYMIIGCPLFTFALGQFAGLMVERAIKRHEIAILRYPLTKEEFQYAADLYADNDPNVLSLGEFTILELLRLGRITTDDLDQIKTFFSAIDEHEEGHVNRPMLVKRNLMRPYGSFDDAMLDVVSNEGDDLFHMLTENDRSNSLPPEITEDMYEQVEVSFLGDEDASRASCSRTGDRDRESDSNTSHRTIKRLRLEEYNEIVVPLAFTTMLDTIDSREGYYCEVDEDLV